MLNFSSRLMRSLRRDWKAGIVKLSKSTAMLLLKFSLFFIAISASSLFFILLLRNHLLPKGELISKEVFFDYDQIRPTAKINLFSKHDQWDIVTTSRFYDSKEKKKTFLKNGMSYNIDAVFYLSKSEKNFQSGKFMTTFSG